MEYHPPVKFQGFKLRETIQFLTPISPRRLVLKFRKSLFLVHAYSITVQKKSHYFRMKLCFSRIYDVPKCHTVLLKSRYLYQVKK